MLADPGAGATFIGVVFGQPAASMTAADVREQLVLGGHVSRWAFCHTHCTYTAADSDFVTVFVQLLVLGGEVFITGCTFLNVNPLATRFPVFMGGDVSNQQTKLTNTTETASDTSLLSVV